MLRDLDPIHAELFKKPLELPLISSMMPDSMDDFDCMSLGIVAASRYSSMDSVITAEQDEINNDGKEEDAEEGREGEGEEEGEEEEKENNDDGGGGRGIGLNMNEALIITEYQGGEEEGGKRQSM